MMRTVMLLAALMIMPGCGGESGDSRSSSRKDKDRGEDTDKDKDEDGDEDKDEGKGRTGGSEYAPPPDLCALADPTLLGAEAGKPGEGYVEKEGTTLPMSGCVFDLVAPDAINTFKVFATVDGDAAARFELATKVWREGSMPGFVSEDISGLGRDAVYAFRLTAEDRRIDTVLAMVDGNLYLEARFYAGGSKTWNAGPIRKAMETIVRKALAKVPRK